ncbi:hypothetical protein LCGC14_0436730 [marine sediment metagenome]|uniref:Uncharacterized protein n=1 Tax=marine sediment metagenome TaxID=412755 RepID=A0A0F9SSS0_9ZZZZ
MGIGRMLAKSAREVVRLQVGDSNIWFDYEIVPIDRAVVLTAQRTTSFALYEVTKAMGSSEAAAAIKFPEQEDLEGMPQRELEQTLGNMMHMLRQIDPGTIKEGAAQIASIVCLGVRRARAWTDEAYLVGEGESLAPRVAPDEDDPDVPFEDIEITTQERLQDAEHDVVWVNSLPPSHIKPLHDAIFSMSSEDAARIARFR